MALKQETDEIARKAAEELHGADKGRKNPALEALKKRSVEIILRAINAASSLLQRENAELERMLRGLAWSEGLLHEDLIELRDEAKAYFYSQTPAATDSGERPFAEQREQELRVKAALSSYAKR